MADLQSEWDQATPIQEEWDKATPIDSGQDSTVGTVLGKANQYARWLDPMAVAKSAPGLASKAATLAMDPSAANLEALAGGVQPGGADLLAGLAANPVKGANAIVHGGEQGGSLGWSDELGAAIGATVPGIAKVDTDSDQIRQILAGKGSWVERYRALRDFYRDRNAQAKKDAPEAYQQAELGGSLALPIPGVSQAAKPTTKILGNLGAGAALSGAASLGGAQGDAGSQAAETAKGAALGAGVGGGTSAMGVLLEKLAPSLREAAAKRAVKALGGERSKTKYMDNPDYGGFPGTSSRAGAEALDQGVSLSNPEKALEQANALAKRAGQAMDATKSTIDAAGSGGAVDFAGFADQVKKKVIGRLNRPEDPLSQSTAKSVGQYMDDLALGMLNKRRTAAGLQPLGADDVKALNIDPAQSLGQITMQEAHDIRRGIDAFTGQHGAPTKSESAAMDELINVRNLVSDEMEAAAGKLHLGEAWQAANRAYKKAANIRTLAKTGVDKQANNAVPLRTAVMTAGAVPAAGAALLSGHPGAAGAALTAPALSWLAEKYGPAAAAHTLNAASRGAVPAGQLLQDAAPWLPRLMAPGMIEQEQQPVEQHAAGGEVGGQLRAWMSGVDDGAKDDFLKFSTDPQYRAARGPYRPEVAPIVRPKE